MIKTLCIFFFCWISSFITAQINLTSSLSACYALNGNGAEPANALTGTLSAVTPTVDRFNNPSSALSFSGSASSFITLPDDPLLKSISGMSFGGWVKTYTLTGEYIIFAKTPGNSNFEAYDLVIINLSGFHFRAQKGSGGSTIIADGTTNVVANTWYHAFATIDNTSIKLYVNGVLENSVPSTFAFNYEVGKNVILGGTNDPGFNLPFNGSLDNMRFYNRVLNASEVNALYTSDPSCLPVPIASFSVSSPSVCPGQTVALTDVSTNTPTAWAWQMAGATPSVSSSANPVISYANPGPYTVSLVASNSFGPSSAVTQTLLVMPVPNVTASTNNSLICSGNSAVLLANGANTYTWSNSQNFQAINVTPTVTTTYTVVGTGSNGCTNSSAITVNVSPCTGLAHGVANSYFEMYPNPTSGKFVIDISNAKANEFTLCNILGEVVLKTRFEANETNRFDISDMANGIYFLKLKSEGSFLTKKLIKQ